MKYQLCKETEQYVDYVESECLAFSECTNSTIKKYANLNKWSCLSKEDCKVEVTNPSDSEKQYYVNIFGKTCITSSQCKTIGCKTNVAGEITSCDPLELQYVNDHERECLTIDECKGETCHNETFTKCRDDET